MKIDPRWRLAIMATHYTQTYRLRRRNCSHALELRGSVSIEARGIGAAVELWPAPARDRARQQSRQDAPSRFAEYRRILAILIFLAALVPVGPASAEYQLSPGDVLEITVASLPELRQRVAVDVDGQAAFPLLGPIKVAGLPLSVLRARLRELLPTKILRRNTPDGREFPVVVTPDEITVAVAEYRPLYLNGDVAKPGAVDYKPGITVRHAVALAGGYDTMRFRAKDPFLTAADLRSEYYALWIEFAKQQGEISLFKAQLSDKAELDKELSVVPPLPTSVVSQINELQAEQLRIREEDHTKEKHHLQGAVQKEDERISVLTDQYQKEREGADADAVEYEQVKQLFQRGIVPTTRLTETRRLTLYSATRALQTVALLDQVQRERQELARRLVKLDDQRRSNLLDALQNAQTRLETIRSRLQSVGEELLYAGAVRSQLVRGKGNEPDVVIFRNVDAKRSTLRASEDSELLPGDVVEIRLRLEDLVGSTADAGGPDRNSSKPNANRQTCNGAAC